MFNAILKKFQEWFTLKQSIDEIQHFPRFKEAEIWWCYLGENIGHEQNGKGEKFLRPVVILKKFNQRLFYGIPTSSIYKDNPYYHELKFKDKTSYALLSQMRAIDAKRLSYKMTKLPDGDFAILQKRISKVILGKN